MITRRGSIVRAMVVFGAIGAAAIVWGYAVLNAQRGGGSVEVQQLAEPAWDVQISELAPDAVAAQGARQGIVVAEGNRALD